MRGLLVILMMLVLSINVVSCSGDYSMSAAENYVATIKAKKPAPIEKFPQLKKFKPVTYNVGNLRDPFSRQNLQMLNQPDLNRIRGPLEQAALDSIKMVGTVLKNNNYWAILRTADGKIYTVKIGDYVGQNFGKIIKIEANQLQILETISDGTAWKKRITIIKMQE